MLAKVTPGWFSDSQVLGEVQGEACCSGTHVARHAAVSRSACTAACVLALVLVTGVASL